MAAIVGLPLIAAPVVAAPQAMAATCTHPRFVSSSPNAMWNSGRYFVANNMWNASGYSMKQTLRACSYRNWSISATADNGAGDGAVKSYPNVHRDWHNWGNGAEPRLSSFTRITSRFAARTPRVGIYNAAYDVWLNGVPGRNEVMIWTKNRRQVPAGSVVARGLKWSHRTWQLWATADNSYLAFVPNRPLNRGTVRIGSMLHWLTVKHRIARGSTLGQIGFGFEIVSTGGQPARFHVGNFSISTRRS